MCARSSVRDLQHKRSAGVADKAWGVLLSCNNTTKALDYCDLLGPPLMRHTSWWPPSKLSTAVNNATSPSFFTWQTIQVYFISNKIEQTLSHPEFNCFYKETLTSSLREPLCAVLWTSSVSKIDQPRIGIYVHVGKSITNCYTTIWWSSWHRLSANALLCAGYFPITSQKYWVFHIPLYRVLLISPGMSPVPGVLTKLSHVHLSYMSQTYYGTW